MLIETGPSGNLAWPRSEGSERLVALYPRPAREDGALVSNQQDLALGLAQIGSRRRKGASAEGDRLAAAQPRPGRISWSTTDSEQGTLERGRQFLTLNERGHVHCRSEESVGRSKCPSHSRRPDGGTVQKTRGCPPGKRFPFPTLLQPCLAKSYLTTLRTERLLAPRLRHHLHCTPPPFNPQAKRTKSVPNRAEYTRYTDY